MVSYSVWYVAKYLWSSQLKTIILCFQYKLRKQSKVSLTRSLHTKLEPSIVRLTSKKEKGKLVILFILVLKKD